MTTLTTAIGGGPSTTLLLKAAQHTIEALTEELVQVRQENAELKGALQTAHKTLHMQRLAAMDELALAENRSGGSAAASSNSVGGQSEVGTPTSSARSRQRLRERSVSGMTPTPVARAKQLLMMTPPFDVVRPPNSESTIVMTDDEDSASAPQRHCTTDGSERRSQHTTAASSVNADVEAYVEDLRRALFNMNQHAAKKQARVAKLETELQNLLAARAKDLEAAREVQRLLSAAKSSEEGARKAAAQAKRELLKVKEECATIRALAAQTIEDLTMRLKEAAASAQTATPASPAA